MEEFAASLFGDFDVETTRLDLQAQTAVPRIALSHPSSELQRAQELNHTDSLSSSDVDSCESDDSDLDIDALLDDISEHPGSPSNTSHFVRSQPSEAAGAVSEASKVGLKSGGDEVLGVIDPTGTGLALPKLSFGTSTGSRDGEEDTKGIEPKSVEGVEGAKFGLQLHSSSLLLESIEKSPKSDIVHQPQPPTPCTSPSTSQAQYSRSRPPIRPEQKNTETVHQDKPHQALESGSQARPQAPPSFDEVNARRMEAERLWKEQVRLEIFCDILRSLSCLKADSRVFKTVTAELKQRVCLQEEARERLEAIRSNLGSAASSASSEQKDAQQDASHHSHSKANESADSVAALDPVIQLEREARQLHEELLSKIRIRAEAEAKKALAEADRKKKDIEQWRRSAKASLEIRKKLQPDSSDPKNGQNGPKPRQTFDPGVRRKGCAGAVSTPGCRNETFGCQFFPPASSLSFEKNAAMVAS